MSKRIGYFGILFFSIFLFRSIADPIDTLILGKPDSEEAHSLNSDHSETLTGGMEQPARHILPLDSENNWEGGRFSFKMKVDPKKQNYLTVRFWGSDTSPNWLILFCEGKQIGYRFIGDVDVLDSPNGSPPYANRFFYKTTPLPLSLTQDKEELEIEIRGTGPIWSYGETFERYQKPMTGSTPAIYRIYTHTDGCFVPPSDEIQGAAPFYSQIRTEPGPEVLDQIQERENSEIQKRLNNGKTLNQHEIWFLARAYHIPWTAAYHQDSVIKKTVTALDALFVAYQANPKLAYNEPSIYNSDWFGTGPAACAVVLLAEPLKPFLDQEIEGASGITRRKGLAEMFESCRDWHREHRRQYTNQTMISDTYGLYMPNRAIAILNPEKALPEEKALHYLYESAGLEPWLGSEKDGVPLKPLGESYYQITEKGLTRELGFVGYYGEVLDWMVAMYNATRPSPDQPGDEKIKAQLIKVARARAAFRAQGLDDDNNRAMRAETIVGWRDQDHYPGDATYAERPTWDATCITVPAATLDPVLVGYVQQMMEDNQLFASLQRGAEKNISLRVTAGLLDAPEDYKRLKEQPAVKSRFPMSFGQPDFVFSDEEDGVVAIKHGDEFFYASLYWRARFAVNSLARVHDTLPQYDRIAVVHEDVQFQDSGMKYKCPDWINLQTGNGGPKYPGDIHSAYVGEELPIAKIPDGVPFKPGQENVYAGKGDFYTLRYGPYLIGMNMTKDQTFEITLPENAGPISELVSKRVDIKAGSTEKVNPRSTVVYYLNSK